MKAEEIMHVLRLVALGRINTPEQVAFCEKLEKLFNPEQALVAVVMEPDGERVITAPKDVADAINIAMEAAIPKRTRKAKAD